MPIFEYKATNTQGEAVSGVLHSSSLGAAADDLAKRGLVVEHVALTASAADPLTEAAPPTETRSAVMTEVVGPLIGVPLSALMFFFRQLATMLNAGINPVQALETLSAQTNDGRLRVAILEMRDNAKAGRPISAGMQRYPELFSPLMMSMVRVGEQSGMMVEALQHTAKYIERELKLRSLINRLTLYPKLVIAASILIVLATNFIIASLGKEGGLSSPLTNPLTWLCLGPLIIALFVFFRVGLHNPRVKHNFDQVILALPYLGPTLHQLAMAKFGRALGTMYRAGVPMVPAIQTAADACGSEFLRAKMYPAAQNIKEGRGITETLAETGAFSPIVLDMVRTGEETGQIDHMMDKMADFYEDDCETRATTMAWTLSIVCLLAVAAYVAYVVITFYVGHFSGLQNALE